MNKNQAQDYLKDCGWSGADARRVTKLLKGDIDRLVLMDVAVRWAGEELLRRQFGRRGARIAKSREVNKLGREIEEVRVAKDRSIDELSKKVEAEREVREELEIELDKTVSALSEVREESSQLISAILEDLWDILNSDLGAIPFKLRRFINDLKKQIDPNAA